MVFDSGEQQGEQRALVATAGWRRLRLAFAASIVLHILIVLQRGQLPASPAAAPNLRATLRPAEGASVPIPAPAPIPAHRAAATATVSPAPTFSAPMVTAAAVPPPATVPAKTSEAVLVSEAASSAPAAPAVRDSPADLVDGLSADGLRRYRLSLATQARRFKRYPAQALASNWTGTVEIRLDIGGDGQPKAPLVLHSSGYAVLDRAALVMIEEGARHASLPVELRGKAFSVVLPVVFDLTDR